MLVPGIVRNPATWPAATSRIPSCASVCRAPMRRRQGVASDRCRTITQRETNPAAGMADLPRRRSKSCRRDKDANFMRLFVGFVC